MPLPKPKDDESKDDFISRCMGNPTMVSEYSDRAQRYAVCEGLWDDKKAVDFVEDLRDLNRMLKHLKESGGGKT